VQLNRHYLAVDDLFERILQSRAEFKRLLLLILGNEHGRIRTHKGAEVLLGETG